MHIMYMCIFNTHRKENITKERVTKKYNSVMCKLRIIIIYTET